MTDIAVYLTTDQVRHIVADMERRQVSDLDSHEDTDRLYKQLFRHVRKADKAIERRQAPRPEWSAGWWRREEATGEYFYTVYTPEWKTGKSLLTVLVRISPVGRSIWYVDLYPTGRRVGEPIPEDADHLHPIHTLAAAKKAAATAWQENAGA